MNIALVGPLPPPFGGVSMSLQRFYLKSFKTIDMDIFDTKVKYKNIFFRKVFFLLKLFYFFFKNKVYEIIHVQFYSIKILFYLVLISKILNSKLILTVNNARIGVYFSKLTFFQSFLYRILLVNISHTVFVSNHAVSSKITNILKKRTVIPSHFSPSNTEINNSPYPLYLSNLIKKADFTIVGNAWKLKSINGEEIYGVPFTLKVIKRLLSEIDLNIICIFVIPLIEDKKLYYRILKEIKASNLGDKFKIVRRPLNFIGLLNDCNILIRPTLTDGSSLSIFESLSIQKPVLASDSSPRLKDVIKFKTNDIEDCLVKLKDVVFNYDFYKEKLQNLEDSTFQIHELYREVNSNEN